MIPWCPCVEKACISTLESVSVSMLADFIHLVAVCTWFTEQYGGTVIDIEC